MVSQLRPSWTAVTIATALLALALMARGAPLAGQSNTTVAPSTPRPVGAAILGGTLGSITGAVVGFGLGAAVDVGLGICATDDLSGDDAFCVAFPAVVLGTIVGSAVGAKLFAERRGASPSLMATLAGATVGLLTGTLGSLAVGAVTDNGMAQAVGFSVGQGTLAGLVAALR